MKLCIYTAVFGGYNDPPAACPAVEGIDYIFFTDRQCSVNNPWQIRIINNVSFNAVDMNRQLKMLPHRYLSEYDASLYLDGNIIISGDLSNFLKFVNEASFIAYRHPLRTSIRQEAAANFRLNRVPLIYMPNVAKQLARYLSNKYPDSELIEANIILRNHEDLFLAKAMDKWWVEFDRGVKRDQLSLGYVLWDEGVKKIIVDAPDRRKKKGLFYCRPHPKGSLRWLRGWLPRKWRMITSSQKFWEKKLNELIDYEISNRINNNSNV